MGALTRNSHLAGTARTELQSVELMQFGKGQIFGEERHILAVRQRRYDWAKNRTPWVSNLEAGAADLTEQERIN